MTTTEKLSGGIVMIVPILALMVAFHFVHEWLWGEREGTIRMEDCRAKIPVREGSSDTWFKKFTCDYRKTKNGKIMGGYCEAVETSGGACETAYYYEKKPAVVCSDQKFPYVGHDDMCHSEPQ